MGVAHKNFLGMPRYESQEDEAYMSSAQQRYFARLLKLWQETLASESFQFKESLQDNESFVDYLDQASQEESQRMGLRASERRRKLQKKLQEARNRLGRGEYGYCKVCGDDIGVSRLEARPTADECINCKTVSELYEKRSLE